MRGSVRGRSLPIRLARRRWQRSRQAQVNLKPGNLTLADKLDAASNAADAQQRSELVEEARQIIERHRDYLAASPIIADLDANPFVPLAIQKTVATTLAALSNTVR